jgi:AcrR family transcriptional regulator
VQARLQRARNAAAERRLDIKKIISTGTIKLVRGDGRVQEIQRTGILEAMAEAMAERGAGAGAGAVTATQVIARAGVSRKVFYELFVDRDACLLAAFDLGVERAGARMARAYAAESRWRDQIRAALATFLRFLEDEPALGRLCVVHALGAGPDVLRRRTEVLAVLWEVVDRGRLEIPAGREQPPAVIAEGVVGAVLSVIHNRLQAGDGRPLMEQFGSLMSIVLLPYLGATIARRELTRPAPRVWSDAEAPPPGEGDAASEALGARLTYRTARVLAAIAEYPGASNREVAERAGIVDQGQISKLLSRLSGLGLIANMGDGSFRGAPNAWRLTERGERVQRAADARLRPQEALSRRA